ncbi:hypothetical protein FBU30_004075 [Linnemannia zychae]|nr:hypothetical protein FBU30_004075 [Linnemannia zychae]
MSLWPKSAVSVEEAINLVTANIALIRRANNKDEILNCGPEKVTMTKVDITSNQPMLNQLAAAYREHAELLKDKGFYEIAKKSWKKADKILSPHQKQGARSIVKAGDLFVSMFPEVRKCLSSAYANPPTTNLSICVASPATQPSSINTNTPTKVANEVVRAFIVTDLKVSDVIAEVVPLAYNLDRDLYRNLLNSFVEVIDRSILLDVDSLDGLAHLIQSADPDAMVASNVGDIDRINLYEPLASILSMSSSKSDPYLSFQVEYAAQALLNVSNDEKPWHAGFRRLWLAISVGASFAKVPDPKEIKMMLEGLEKLYNEGMSDFNKLKEIINGKRRVEFTFKDGFQFKSIWYRALRTAELYIQSGKLTYFEESENLFGRDETTESYNDADSPAAFTSLDAIPRLFWPNISKRQRC